MEEAMHKTKDGREIPIRDMEWSHLVRVVNLFKRRAAEGVKVQRGGGSCPDDFWYEEYIVDGADAFEHLGFAPYEAEYNRRLGLNKKTKEQEQ